MDTLSNFDQEVAFRPVWEADVFIKHEGRFDSNCRVLLKLLLLYCVLCPCHCFPFASTGRACGSQVLPRHLGSIWNRPGCLKLVAIFPNGGLGMACLVRFHICNVIPFAQPIPVADLVVAACGQYAPKRFPML